MKNNQRRWDKGIQCPYYHKHDGISIYCDGLCKGSLSSKDSFEDAKTRENYMHEYCCKEWQQCGKGNALDDY